MENRSLPIGFIIKQVNNVYEKDLNERLKKIGITSSQCAVLDYLFHTSKDEVSQRDVEKNLNLKNPTVMKKDIFSVYRMQTTEEKR